MNHLRLLRSCAFLASVVTISAGVNAQIAIAPAATVPNPRAMLDLSNDVTRGFLAPRVVFAERPTAPVNSLFIFQTDSVSGAPRGFYYYDATIPQWSHVANGPGWKLGGNSGTNPAVDFIGTSVGSAQPLAIRTNGVQRALLNTTGQFQLGDVPLQAPTERLDVKGGVRITGTSAVAATEGAIRYNATTGAHEGYVNNPLVAPAGQIQYVGWYQLENAFKVRVKQKYQSVPVISCQYPAPIGVPAGGFAGSWPVIDVNGAGGNPSSAATLETPYSMFWEDGRHQYLYLSQDLINLNVCPNTDVKGIAFQTAAAGVASGSVGGVRNWRISMKNTTTSTLNDFDYTGLQLTSSGPGPYLPVNGWNSHVFNVSNWQWIGPGFNMLVEFGFDNQDWVGCNDTPVNYETTAYNATAGARCDACGNVFNNFNATCVWNAATCGAGSAGIPNVLCPNTINTVVPGGIGPAPGVLYPGVPWNAIGPDATHVQCQGWGHTPGPQLTFAQFGSPTCDCTIQYTAAVGVTARRPLLKFDAQVNGIGISYPNGNYLLSQKGVMIGDYATWANSALYVAPNYQHKGPGTISARSSVWGGAVLLSDHVFDKYYDGVTKLEDAKQAMGYKHYPLKEMANYVEQEHHLPTIGGREDWEKTGQFSVDQLTNQLWVTVETQSLYIKELNDRMTALQNYLVEKRLKDLKK
ncbi:MAG: hypothetical protein IPO90_15710 [Flavobacteriales bacterium]|nr:hypothetical protein [Flavobacteriales bacterium]